MPCLNPITIPTRTRYINSRTVGAAILQTVPCGKCSECLQNKQNEYCLRAQAEYEATQKKGGFCYWDTLTYSNKNVPTFTKKTQELGRGLTHYECNLLKHDRLKSKMLCFNTEDFKLCMKRLRTRLSRHGYDVKENLKYFFVSEYGGITHRPHYHVIFFISFDISPTLFRKYLDEAWSLGRLDNTKSALGRVLDGVGAINYVAKYVSKDTEFERIIGDFIDVFKTDKKVINQIKTFHRSSQGFGLSIIDQQDYDFMFSTGTMRITDSFGVHFVPLPMYIQRKLWYKQVKWLDGSLHWILNDEGKKRAKQFIIPQQIQNMADNYEQWFNNAEVLEDIEVSYAKDVIREAMDERSFYDLAVYTRLYKNRHFDYLPSVDEMIDIIVETENKDYSDSLIDEENILQGNIYKRVTGGYEDLSGNFMKTSDFISEFCTNLNDYEVFRNFDLIIGLFDVITLSINKQKEEEFRRRQAIKNRLKKLKINYEF